MGVTNRGVEKGSAQRSTRLLKSFARFLVPIMRLLLKPFPGVRARLAETLGGRSGHVFSLLQKNQYGEAYKRAMEGVTYCENRRLSFDMQKLYWWTFMECAALGAAELGEKERQEVLARLGNSPEPGGLLEARTLAGVSRWKWKAGDLDGAIEFARLAVMADATWPQGHILLAWYGLVSGSFDPLPRLQEAVRTSPSCLEEIRADAEFAKFPKLIAALSKASS